MKTLYIVRHAKSSWADFTSPDFDRPLNDRGKRDAPEMARRLLKKELVIDAFISSPAKRALSTCKAFCKEYNRDKDSIILVDKLYHASIDTFYKTVRGINDSYAHVALFSHNPGITEFVNSLQTDVKIDNMPTCGIFAFTANIKNWEEFDSANTHFLFFEYPKLKS